MFRLLIADDEKNERDCLKYLLENTNLSLEIREAQNGAEALEILDNWKADILLTDIQMPVMGGLELIDRVSQKSPDIRIIIFSNYAEFEYAKAALHFGVENYILKPVIPSELESTLRSVTEQLEEERSVTERLQTSMLQSAVQFSIYGTLNPDSFDNEILEQLKDFKRLILLEFPVGFLEKNYSEFYDGLRNKLNLDFVSLNFSPQSLLALKHDILDEAYFGQKLFNHIDKEYGISCYITISPLIDENSSLKEAFSHAEQQMEQRFWSQNEHVFISQNEPAEYFEADENTDDDTLMNMIKNALASRDGDKFTKSINQFLQKYRKQSNQSQFYVKYIFSNLAASLYPYLPQSEKSDGKSIDDLISMLYLQRDLSKIVDMVQQLAQSVVNTFEENTQSERKEIVIVKNYIHEHYGQELSVELLASTVFLSPDYLSRLFKKSTGKSLYQYICQYRMEKASSLLKNTTKKVIDIGIETGYSNYSYFCQSFREYFGKSPERYRQEESNA